MLVGDVYPLRVGEASGPLTLSAGKPVAGSVMATIEAQVSWAQRWIVPRSIPPQCWSPADGVDAEVTDAGAVDAAYAFPGLATVRPTAATAAPPTRSCRRLAMIGLGRQAEASVMFNSLVEQSFT